MIRPGRTRVGPGRLTLVIESRVPLARGGVCHSVSRYEHKRFALGELEPYERRHQACAASGSTLAASAQTRLVERLSPVERLRDGTLARRATLALDGAGRATTRLRGGAGSTVRTSIAPLACNLESAAIQGDRHTATATATAGSSFRLRRLWFLPRPPPRLPPRPVAAVAVAAWIFGAVGATERCRVAIAAGQTIVTS